MISRSVTIRFLAALAMSLPLLAAAAERPVKGDPPEFPSEANRAGYNEGMLKVRLNVDPSGEVNRVEVLESNPRRVFDRATVRALSQWRYAGTGSARVLEFDVHYKR
jgi:protein TonB